MADISATQVKELREKTGAGMMDCKKALAETNGDFEKAIDVLRKKGLKSVGKRADKVAAEGTVYSYVHAGGKIGVLVELNCETDFVAKGEGFQALAKAIAMHIAWANPRYLSRDLVPEGDIHREREVHAAQLKPEQQKMADKILAGKLDKFFQENCLVEQLDVRDASGKKRIEDLLTELSATVGEKVVLRRFVRYEVGEGIEKVSTDYAAEVAAVAGA